MTQVLTQEHVSINAEIFRDKVGAALAEIKCELAKQQEQHPNLLRDDFIRDRITSVLDGCVGSPYSQEQLNEIYKKGTKRYENKVPPGYKDLKKGDVNRYGSLVIEQRFGDLIIWLQMIDKAKQTNNPIVFVTDDKKEDWWWKDEKRGTIGPRPELVTEMRAEADIMFYVYTPRPFMEYARDYLKLQVTADAISEIAAVTASNWKDEIVNALRALGGEANLTEIYEQIRSSRILTNRDLICLTLSLSMYQAFKTLQQIWG